MEDTDRRPLARGDACSACKRRKIKCSGEKPTCAKCAKTGRFCEYTQQLSSATHGFRDGSSSSRTVLDAPAHQWPVETPSNGQYGTTSIPPTTSSSTRHAYGYPSGGHFDPSSSAADALVRAYLSSSLGGGMSSSQQEPSWTGIDFANVVEDMSPSPLKRRRSLDPHTLEQVILMYFANQSMFGLEMHISTFYIRLGLHDRKQRPHPALLYAMCLATSHAISFNPADDEEVYLSEASQRIDEAMTRIPDLPEAIVDLTRATALVSGWLWAHNRDAEALMMSCKAARFVQISGLDKLDSSTLSYKPERPARVRRAVKTRTLCPPPRDAIEVGERIYAFWAIYLLDLCAAIGAQVPPCFDPASVTTPLPKPWSEFEMPSGSPPPDDTISYLFDPTKTTSSETDLAHIVKGLTLLYYASRAHRPDPSTSRSPSLANSPFTESTGSSHNHSKASVVQALERFQASLPSDIKAGPRRPSGEFSLSSRTMTMQFILVAAEMFLHDNNTYSAPNETALYHAKKIVSVIKLLGKADMGDLGAFIFVLWCLVARILIREHKRLDRAGDDFAASLIQVDIDVIIHALETNSDKSIMAANEANVIRQYQIGPPSEDGDASAEVEGWTGTIWNPKT